VTYGAPAFIKFLRSGARDGCGNRSSMRGSEPETLYLEGSAEVLEMERALVSTQIGEQLQRRQSRPRAAGAVSDRASTTIVEPVPRIALTQQEACASLGCSEEFFVEHVRPHLRVVRRGRKRLFPVAELRRAVDEMAENVI